MALDKSQRKFIRRKVRKLKSRKEVEAFYCDDDLVCKFANTYARKLYGIKRRIK